MCSEAFTRMALRLDESVPFTPQLIEQMGQGPFTWQANKTNDSKGNFDFPCSTLS